MDALTEFMNQRFSPYANRISKNLYISAIQDSIMTILPLILVGSIVTIFSLLNELISSLPDLSKISDFSFGLVGIGVAFLIPYFIMEKSDFDSKKLISGATGLALFLMFIGPVSSNDGNISFVQERFGATGLFVSMVAGIFTGIIMRLFSKKSLFDENSAMPEFIIVWFDSLIPIMVILILGWVATDVFTLDLFSIILTIFSPLTKVIQTFPGFVFLVFLEAFLYSFGISPWILSPISYPVFLSGIAENARQANMGQTATNIATSETVYMFAIGGLGCTLILAILMAFFAKSERLKMMGKATLIPSLFNVNEPLVFGAPIVFNPYLMIPFWLTAMIPAALTYLSMSLGLVSIPIKTFQLWYMPYPFLTYFASGGDWKSLILLIVIVGVTFFIWYPFFKVYDNQQLQLEKENKQEE